MSYRVEDQGITLRLYPTEQEARKAFGAHDVFPYRGGWLVKNGAGQWMEENGNLPRGWAPQPDAEASAPT